MFTLENGSKLYLKNEIYLTHIVFLTYNMEENKLKKLSTNQFVHSENSRESLDNCHAIDFEILFAFLFIVGKLFSFHLCYTKDKRD